MTEFLVREAKTTDIEVLVEMIHALSAFHGERSGATAADVRHMLLEENSAGWGLVAQAKGKAIGYAAVFTIPKLQDGVFRADLHHLYVAENWRGAGVGRRLVETAIEKSRKLGMVSLIIGTDPKNTGAQSSYRAMGLEDVPAPGPRFKIDL